MSVLSGKTIEESNIIDPFTAKYCQPASYDLTVGDEIYMWEKEHKNKVEITKPSDGDEIKIEPNHLCFILSKEKITLPEDVAGSVSLRMDHLTKGIMLAAQPPIDPRYSGKIVGMLYNLSNKPISINQGETFLTLELRRVAKPLFERPQSEEHEEPYSVKKLKDVIKAPVSSSLRDLRDKIRAWQNRLNNTIPVILTALSIAVALIALFTGILLF